MKKGNLVKKQIVDKNGKRQTVWVRAGEKPSGEKPSGSKEDSNLVSVAKHKELLNALLTRISDPKNKNYEADYKEAKTMVSDLTKLDSKVGVLYKKKLLTAQMSGDGVKKGQRKTQMGFG